MSAVEKEKESHEKHPHYKKIVIRPVVLWRLVRAPESAMFFIVTVVFVHAVGFSFGDFADSHVVIPLGLVAPSPTHRLQGMTM